MRILAVVAVLDAAAIGVRMGSMVLVIRAVPGVVMVRAASILMVADGHALRGRHRSYALDREGQGKQRDGKEPESPKQHCRKLYASRFECDS
jgi:hypothetical protein